MKKPSLIMVNVVDFLFNQCLCWILSTLIVNFFDFICIKLDTGPALFRSIASKLTFKLRQNYPCIEPQHIFILVLRFHVFQNAKCFLECTTRESWSRLIRLIGHTLTIKSARNFISMSRLVLELKNILTKNWFKTDEIYTSLIAFHQD